MSARVVVALGDDLRRRILRDTDLDRLAAAADVVLTRDPAALDAADICVTGWDTPPLPPSSYMDGARLRLVAHTGGSVRHLVPAAALDRGLRVTQVAAVLAEAVAEFAVMSIIAGLRDAVGFATALRSGEPWADLAARPPGRLLRDQTVGIVGASRTGRATLHRLRPFGCRCLVYDPYLSAADATALGAEPADLPRLLREADVVTLHAPVLPSTRGMIGAAEVAALRPGALVVNTARSALVDGAALLAAAARGRVRVVTDVFDTEPLPADDPWRRADGVVATPHIAALTAETLREQGAVTVDEVLRFLAGRPLEHEITRAAYDTAA
ncbi:hydroxyacid dehydrogenase [Jiangella alkaliphila]|uniref:Phosphoglycerate dehydrogenase n=1 Tax=Jiangella alkaliphila TaxID=419479 RepID=A0A1H2J7H4_9ACTN|nr:hydroxyacid dehydrogenase [Jiangella alkaliphila]SDU52095.1 Phosphoglycerate dehydrogenase [Jiangella alkaliphila]